MLPHDPILPDEEKQIADLPEGQNGGPRHCGFNAETIDRWSRIIVWSQLIVIPLLGIQARYGWAWGNPRLRQIADLEFGIGCFYTLLICPLAVAILFIGGGSRRSGCGLVILEMLLVWMASVAMLPMFQ